MSVKQEEGLVAQTAAAVDDLEEVPLGAELTVVPLAEEAKADSKEARREVASKVEDGKGADLQAKEA